MTPSKPIQILTIVGNPRRSSRTRTAGEAVASAIARWLHDQGIQTERETLETIDLAGAGLFTGDDPDVAAADTQTRSADLLVVATPTYKASYTGLLKEFLDNNPIRLTAGPPGRPPDGWRGAPPLPRPGRLPAARSARARSHLPHAEPVRARK